MVVHHSDDNAVMCVLSKLLSFLTQPLSWVALLLLAGLLSLSRWPRQGRRLCTLALVVLLLQGWMGPPTALLHHLESRYPARHDLPDAQRYAGVVVLGGALESPELWEAHGQPALNSAAERMTAVLPLLQRHQNLMLLFTGGHGQLLGRGLTEAQRAEWFYRSMNVPAQRLILESASRNTYENAVLSAALPGVDKTRPWLLVTSAWHMPRAMATFEKAGWNVTAYPVDFITGRQAEWTDYALSNGVWDTALHEYLGLLAYRLSGKL